MGVGKVWSMQSKTLLQVFVQWSFCRQFNNIAPHFHCTDQKDLAIELNILIRAKEQTSN